ncbi:Gfo/Idh/MocA family protein [Cochlodiniinecator piscidefendens]|uniref:Gfo/Idh/MocA family protein n=1 Tax=Cochlodiniinecator piscidefendens TaxID=2715756 RepID=UPI00140992A4|nr:Gfo/Idh/MocA family oxidoreductase [Cochlodiniinecator piscidefendens]
MTAFYIIGCGFVADLYMRSFALYSDAKISAAFDQDPDRRVAFAKHWDVSTVDSLETLFECAQNDENAIFLNLTNPDAHFELNKLILEAGFHCYCEKPLAMDMTDAQSLYALADDRKRLLASAPCSYLGEAAQTLAKAVRDNIVGIPRLVYAELDDGFIPQARYHDWISESGAPWPYKDEFNVGCTLEHAGYYLTWLIAMFGPVKQVVAASAALIPDKPGPTDTPDFSTATLFFTDGMVARLTCSIVAPHNHQIRVIGENGVLAVKKAWDNAATVKFHRRFNLRRRLLEHPFGKRVKVSGPTHPQVTRKGAAAMNFALGPIEMRDAIRENRPCRMAADFALHVNEITLAIQNSGAHSGALTMQTSCQRPDLMDWAK